MTAVEAPAGRDRVLPGGSGVADVVADLRSTFDIGRTRSLAWRRSQLEGLARLVRERETDIADAVAADLGRSAMATFMADVAPVRAEIRHTLAKLATWAAPQRVALPAGQKPGAACTVAEPKGVVLVIGAWNFPILLTLQPLVSALAAGNTVVVKPSEYAPRSAALLADLLPRYVEPGAVRVVTGDAAIGAALLEQPFDHIFFTGSTRVGRIVAEAAARRLVPFTLELGGKSPVIVAEDANVAIAAKRIAWAKCINGGQTCTAPDYVLVADAVRPAFMEALLRELPEAARHDSTVVVDDGHFARLTKLLDGHGGHVTGGDSDAATRRFAATIVTDPDPGSDLMQEEIFGPILPVVAVADLDEAIAFVNARPRPLALYLFSESEATAQAVLARTSSGSAVVNHLLYQALVPDLPFGGVGASGTGSYHGQHGFDTFSHRKAVLRKPTSPDPSIAYPPYGPFATRLLRRLMG